MKPRHIVAALLLLAEAPILVVLAAGTLVTGALYALAVGAEHTRSGIRAVRATVAGRLQASALRSQSRRRPPRVGGTAWGW